MEIQAKLWYYGSFDLVRTVELLKDPAIQAQIRKETDDLHTDYENLYLNAGGCDGIVRSREENAPRGWGTMVHASYEFTK